MDKSISVGAEDEYLKWSWFDSLWCKKTKQQTDTWETGVTHRHRIEQLFHFFRASQT